MTTTTKTARTTAEARSPLGAWTRLGAAALAMVLLAGAAATPAAGQEWSVDGELRACGVPWAALGIGRIACSACSLSYGRGVTPSAHFGTEPEVWPLDASPAEGDAVHPGDRLVAVDGALITTAAGVERLLSVREGDEVTLRVRRDGRTRDLDIVAGDACDAELPPLPAAAPAPPTARPQATPRPDPSPSPLPPVSARQPAPPLPAPEAPGALLPEARLGFAFSCSRCGIRDDRWWFTSLPTVTGVERDGPAWNAGLRTGDVIVGIDGHALESEEGARAFGGIEPGDVVRWRVRRGGELREFRLTAEERPPVPSPAPLPRPAPATGRPPTPGSRPALEVLRYQGRVGGMDVEVRGAPVTVTVNEETGEMVIRTSDSIVRLTRTSTGG